MSSSQDSARSDRGRFREIHSRGRFREPLRVRGDLVGVHRALRIGLTAAGSVGAAAPAVSSRQETAIVHSGVAEWSSRRG